MTSFFFAGFGKFVEVLKKRQLPYVLVYYNYALVWLLSIFLTFLTMLQIAMLRESIGESATFGNTIIRFCEPVVYTLFTPVYATLTVVLLLLLQSVPRLADQRTCQIGGCGANDSLFLPSGLHDNLLASHDVDRQYV